MVEKETGHRPATPFDQRKNLRRQVDRRRHAGHAQPLARPRDDLGRQAGKDVHVEKPALHNIFEGRKAVEAAQEIQPHRPVRDAMPIISYDVFLGRGRKPGPQGNVPGNPMMDTDHFRNWVLAMRSRKPRPLRGDRGGPLVRRAAAPGQHRLSHRPDAQLRPQDGVAPWATPRPRSCCLPPARAVRGAGAGVTTCIGGLCGCRG